MTDYVAPIADIRFAAEEIAGLADVTALPGLEEITPDLAAAALEEAGRLAAGVLGPLNRVGDTTPSRLENGKVRTPPGFAEAYRAFCEGGWNGAPFAPEHGGQGMPWLLSTAFMEMAQSANLAFSLCPLLTQGAIELLEAHGSDEQKALYLEKMVTGEWTGTMNLTEPHAGSDVGALRTRAVPEGDHYRISGQKIFITYGDHDFTDNVVHMVLARTPDAPAGIRGVSLFIVPKFMVDADGKPGARNDLRAGSLEHKIGIHASPTCVMLFGENEGAIGYLVGEENRGIEYMFTMMNNARLGVGLQGLAIGERACQQAVAYAKSRVQMRDAVRGGRDAVTIIHHPDVRRMLLTMKSQVEAMRAMAYYTAARLDIARRATDDETRRAAQTRADLMIPIVKAWCTDVGCEVASTNVQVHGGMGFIEETGAGQHYRDARIAPIYEGTNGIQAIDLVGRKVARDAGEGMTALIAEMRTDLDLLAGAPGDDLAAIGTRLTEGVTALESATRWMAEAYGQSVGDALAGATPYLRLAGTVVAAWLLARGAMAATRRLGEGGVDAVFLETRLVTARWFAEQILPSDTALTGPIRDAGRLVPALSEDQF